MCFFASIALGLSVALVTNRRLRSTWNWWGNCPSLFLKCFTDRGVSLCAVGGALCRWTFWGDSGQRCILGAAVLWTETVCAKVLVGLTLCIRAALFKTSTQRYFSFYFNRSISTSLSFNRVYRLELQSLKSALSGHTEHGTNCHWSRYTQSKKRIQHHWCDSSSSVKILSLSQTHSSAGLVEFSVSFLCFHTFFAPELTVVSRLRF